ncbi:ABC transporter ATP-binding protein [Nakamurella flavida]|uniref:ABC transporter ATP-binding protein n=1 Tax=Nakamurella flavida TaxID=363630 RepID=A0A938YL13_9ACTN|nr:ABC transporter ATP-binding protein [Nakamurella flavida]MBM9476643.1 ABC transporter ATP-binding protein [Nakamurella flavida]MDP9778919.1 ATP-binding cassette subfamily C protein [Nakamurella flavida]
MTGPGGTGDEMTGDAGSPVRATLPVASGRATWRALVRAAAAHGGLTLGTVLLTCVAGIGVVAGPVLLGQVVDTVRAGSTSALVPLLVGLGAAVVLTAVFTGWSLREAQRLGATISADLREEVLAAALTLPAPVLEEVGHGDVASRVTEDVEYFVESVPVGAAVFTSAITVLWSATGFAVLDWRLALAFLTVLPVYAVGLRWYLPRAAPIYARERRLAADRSGVILQTLHGLSTVRAYGTGPLQTGRIERAGADNLAAAVAARGLFSRFGLFTNGAEAVGLCALIVVGHLLVGAQATTVGAVTAAALLFHRLFGPLGILLMSFDDVQRAGAALARMVGVTATPRADLPAHPGPDGPVTVRVRGLGHSYDGVRPVLTDVELVVPAGTSLAVVGASGAGKTTLAALIGGAFPAATGHTDLVTDAGTVTVGRLGEDELRSWVGIVTQETHVFSGSVRADVTLAAPDRSEAQLRAALALVGADTWVDALPEGLDTLIGGGGHALTAVQVQQLALARIALRDPPVVILDEATAEAGSAGARQLESAAGAVLRGRTAVVVAHRLTQARACDAIAVLAHGRVVELGSHDDLVARGGRYATLWSTWSRG